MANCPFCSSEIDEDLLVFGGTCPNCFGEIPGEEAPTDPGEEVKAAQDRADTRRAQRRALIPVLLIVPFIFGLLVVGVFLALKPEPELALIDFDGEFYDPTMDVVLTAMAEPEPEPKTEEDTTTEQPTKTAPTTRPIAKATRTAPTKKPAMPMINITAPTDPDDALNALAKRDDGDGVVRRVSAVDKDERLEDMVVEGRAPSSSISIGSADVGVAPAVGTSSRVLKNEDEIRRAVARVLSKRLPRLTSCYQRQLNAKPDLAGRWTLTFSVQPDGSVLRPVATGQSMRDDALETCLTDQMKMWRFPKIAKAAPVKKTVTFRPG